MLLPVILAAHNAVMHPLHCLTPLHFLPLKVSVLFGRAFQKMAVSSAVKMSSGLKLPLIWAKLSDRHVFTLSKSTDALSPAAIRDTTLCRLLQRVIHDKLMLISHPRALENSCAFLCRSWSAMPRKSLAFTSVNHRRSAASTLGRMHSLFLLVDLKTFPCCWNKHNHELYYYNRSNLCSTLIGIQ